MLIFSHFLYDFRMFKFNFNQESEENEKPDLTKNFVKGDENLCKEHEEISLDFKNEIQVLETLGLKHIDSAEAIGKMDKKPDYLNESSDLVKNGESFLTH